MCGNNREFPSESYFPENAAGRVQGLGAAVAFPCPMPSLPTPPVSISIKIKADRQPLRDKFPLSPNQKPNPEAEPGEKPVINPKETTGSFCNNNPHTYGSFQGWDIIVVISVWWVGEGKCAFFTPSTVPTPLYRNHPTWQALSYKARWPWRHQGRKDAEAPGRAHGARSGKVWRAPSSPALPGTQ